MGSNMTMVDARRAIRNAGRSNSGVTLNAPGATAVSKESLPFTRINAGSITYFVTPNQETGQWDYGKVHFDMVGTGFDGRNVSVEVGRRSGWTDDKGKEHVSDTRFSKEAIEKLFAECGLHPVFPDIPVDPKSTEYGDWYFNLKYVKA